jgi:urea transporter
MPGINFLILLVVATGAATLISYLIMLNIKSIHWGMRGFLSNVVGVAVAAVMAYPFNMQSYILCLIIGAVVSFAIAYGMFLRIRR